MKAGLFTLAALSAVAVAQPHQGHKHMHAKKQVVEYVTEVTHVTATAPAEIVYVDQYGNKIAAPSKETQAPAPVNYGGNGGNDNKKDDKKDSGKKNDNKNSGNNNEAPAPSSKDDYSPPASSTKENSAPSSSSGPTYGGDAGGDGYGITYSPYNGDHSCKSADQVKQDLEAINGYSHLRIYGVDCNQVENILPVARAKNMKVFAGIFNIHDVDNEAQTLIDAADGDWSNIETVSVGNEGVNNGEYSIGQVAAAVETARTKLRSAGYKGDVVTVDTFIAIIENPGLCAVGDYVAANCHAYFDGGVTASESGKFVKEQAERVNKACGGDKRVVITEAGWPSSGSSNGKAVPSQDNQKAAVESLKSNFDKDLYMFMAFNGHWKEDNAYTYGAEKFYGIYGDCPSEL